MADWRDEIAPGAVPPADPAGNQTSFTMDPGSAAAPSADWRNTYMPSGAAVTAPPPDRLEPAAYYDFPLTAMHGLTVGLSDPARALVKAGGRYLSGQTEGFDYGPTMAEIMRGREAYAGAHPYLSALGNLGGAIAGPASAAANAIRVAGPLAKVAIGGITGGLLGGVEGAADNATSVPNALEGAKTGAEWGAAVGGGIPAVASAARALVPEISNAAQTLRTAGIEPPPGAAVGGLPGILENIGAHVPILGAPINAARVAAREQLDTVLAGRHDGFNRDLVNRPLAAVGETLSPNTALGHDAAAEMGTKISDAYNRSIPAAGGIVDPQVRTGVADVIANTRLSLPIDRADQFENFVQNQVLRRMQQGQMSGQDFKDVETALGQEARNQLRGVVSPDNQTLAEGYRKVQSEVRDWLARVSPQNAADIQAANTAWRLMLPVRDAVGRAPVAQNGVVTPEQFLNSARRYSGIPQFARGAAPMQTFAQDALMQRNDLTDAGRDILGRAGGTSHTPGVATSIVGADLLEHFFRGDRPGTVLAAATAYPALAGLYSDTGRRAINSLLSRVSSIPSPAPYAPAAGQLAAGGAFPRVISGLLGSP